MRLLSVNCKCAQDLKLEFPKLKGLWCDLSIKPEWLQALLRCSEAVTIHVNVNVDGVAGRTALEALMRVASSRGHVKSWASARSGINICFGGDSLVGLQTLQGPVNFSDLNSITFLNKLPNLRHLDLTVSGMEDATTAATLSVGLWAKLETLTLDGNWTTLLPMLWNPSASLCTSSLQELALSAVDSAFPGLEQVPRSVTWLTLKRLHWQNTSDEVGRLMESDALEALTFEHPVLQNARLHNWNIRLRVLHILGIQGLPVESLAILRTQAPKLIALSLPVQPVKNYSAPPNQKPAWQLKTLTLSITAWCGPINRTHEFTFWTQIGWHVADLFPGIETFSAECQRTVYAARAQGGGDQSTNSRRVERIDSTEAAFRQRQAVVFLRTIE